MWIPKSSLTEERERERGGGGAGREREIDKTYMQISKETDKTVKKPRQVRLMSAERKAKLTNRKFHLQGTPFVTISIMNPYVNLSPCTLSLWDMFSVRH